MDRAIYELKSIIERHEKQRQETLEFYQTHDFRINIQEPSDKNIDFITHHTNRIYDEYIGELQKAIDTLERVRDSRRKQYRRRYK